MSKVIDKIVVSTVQPKTTNVAQFDGNGLKIFTKGKWVPALDINEQVNIVVTNIINTPV